MSDEARSPIRRLRQWAIILALVAGVYLYAESAQQRSPLLGEPAPELGLWVVAGGDDAEEDRALRLAERRGQVTVLDFWASWCSACKRATPMLNALQSDFAEQGVSFFAVNVEPVQPSLVAAAHLSFGTDFPTLHDRSGAVQRAYSVSLLPTVVIIDSDGLVSYVSSGLPNESRLREAISQAIE